MAHRIPLYVPNISTDRLIELLASNLNVEEDLITFERLSKGAKFRAPEVAVIVNSDAEDLLIGTVKCIIDAARILGATQFSIEHEGFDMRLRPTSLDGQHIEHLMIASGSFPIDQINIF